MASPSWSKLASSYLFFFFFFSLIYDKRYNWSAYLADSFPLYETSFKSANHGRKQWNVQIKTNKAKFYWLVKIEQNIFVDNV